MWWRSKDQSFEFVAWCHMLLHTNDDTRLTWSRKCSVTRRRCWLRSRPRLLSVVLNANSDHLLKISPHPYSPVVPTHGRSGIQTTWALEWGKLIMSFLHPPKWWCENVCPRFFFFFWSLPLTSESFLQQVHFTQQGTRTLRCNSIQTECKYLQSSIWQICSQPERKDIPILRPYFVWWVLICHDFHRQNPERAFNVFFEAIYPIAGEKGQSLFATLQQGLRAFRFPFMCASVQLHPIHSHIYQWNCRAPETFLWFQHSFPLSPR